MALKKMSFDTADEIINLYSKLLIDFSKLKKYAAYSYSDLKGYDPVDVSNAINLMIAYKFFNNPMDDNNETIELNKFVSNAESSLFWFSDFFPDEVADKLSKINQSNPLQAVTESIRIKSDSENFEWHHLINSIERPDSFLTYCQTIGNKDPDYWEKIYLRIGIKWETNNINDRIYFIIKNKVHFNQIINADKKADRSTKTTDLTIRKNLFKLFRDKVFPQRE
jgi:hypothetical protein